MKKIAFGMAGLLLALSVLCAQAEEPAAISIIGGADGPTSIFLAGKLSDNDTEAAAQRLYALKTAYVGDAPAVGAILTELSEQGYFPSAEFTFEIHSDKAPYGLTVSFTEAPQDLLSAEWSLVNGGNLLLALIENLSEAEFTYPVEGKETPAHLYVNPETAKLALDGRDIREYSESPEKFAELLQYPASPVYLAEKAAYTFGDGTAADLWKSPWLFGYDYRLADGTALLWKNELGKSDDFGEGFDQLEPEIQDAIRQFYAERGELYDITVFLDQAYADYLQCQNSGQTFEKHILIQEVSPGVETENAAAYTTSLMYPSEPHNNGTASQDFSSVIFDKATGRVIDMWELFCVPEAEAKKQLTDYCLKQDDTLSAEEIVRALDAEHIVWTPDALEIHFPAGTLPDAEDLYICALPYREIDSLLRP